MRISFSQTVRRIKQDMQARCSYENKSLGFLRGIILMLNPGIVCVILMRFQQYFDGLGLRPLAGLLRWVNLILFQIQIDSRADIAGGLVVIHAYSVFIGAKVRIGANCILFHQNTIGYSPYVPEGEQEGITVVGENVIFGAGSCALGMIEIGDGCKIGVNSVVEKSFDENMVLFGIPARTVSKTQE